MTPPRFVPFVHTFVPFAAALTAANVYAEMSADLTFGRVIGSILVSALFALPACLLYAASGFAEEPSTAARYRQLLWTFGYLAYVIHYYYSVGVWFGWDFAQIYRRQGTLVASTNSLLLVTWGIDVLFGLFGPRAGGRFIRGLRWLTHLHFMVAFFVAAVVFRSDVRTSTSLWLGITNGAAILFYLFPWKFRRDEIAPESA
jgi:hypothetical protein